MGLTPGGTRDRLEEVLPLDTPYLIQIFPSYACNFRCGFCLYALKRQKHGFISDNVFMELPLYNKCIEDIKQFPRPLKMLRFGGIGEPLLHPDIAEMVAAAKQAGIARSVDIVTNAALLTPELSLRLIDSGLDRLRISVEGLSAQEYEQNAGAKIDFGQFISQIKYFYEHNEHTHIYIKIIDYMVQTPEKKSRFYELFQPICHSIAIEHLTPTISEIDYVKLSDGMRTDQAQNGGRLLSAQICPQGFYMMQINPDGKVVPCCSMRYPAILGDISSQTVPEIWTGALFNRFRSHMLQSRRQASMVCQDCTLYQYGLYPEDVLDGAQERLMMCYPF